MVYLGIIVAAISKTYSMATHINMGTNVLFSCLCGKFLNLNLNINLILNLSFCFVLHIVDFI